MKIRQKLLATFTIVTVTICLLVVITGIIISRNNLNRELEFSNVLLHHLSDDFQKINENSLTEYTKEYLNVKTSNLLFLLTPLLQKADYDIEKIKNNEKVIELINNHPLKIGKHEVGYFLLLNGAGSVIIGPPNIIILSEDFYKNIFLKINELNLECLKNGFAEGYYNYVDKTGIGVVKKYATMYKIPNSDFIVTGLLNLKEYYNSANKHLNNLNNGFIKKQRVKLTDHYKNSIIKETALFACCILLIIILNIFLINFIMGILTKPIRNLTEKLKIFNPDKFNFEINIPKYACNEIVDLVNAFLIQEKELKRYMVNFKKELESKHILEHELEAARKIQLSVLPKITGEFERKEFSVFAKLIPAKEVSGDFYDFFYLDDDRIAFLIADVSGKGIPAALFMQRAKTILKTSCKSENYDPGKALSKANNALSKNNEACMFVTAFLIYYNIKTGGITYANAGHHATVKATDNNLSNFGKFDNIALGTFENVNYNSGTDKISQGNTLIFFTDGIVEAVSPSFEEFGFTRFYQIIQSAINCPIKELADKILDKVHEFEEQSQFDDITLLILRREK